MDDAERQLREHFTRQGVDLATIEAILADVTAKAQPGTWVGPFQIPREWSLKPDRKDDTNGHNLCECRG